MVQSAACAQTRVTWAAGLRHARRAGGRQLPARRGAAPRCDGMARCDLPSDCRTSAPTATPGCWSSLAAWPSSRAGTASSSGTMSPTSLGNDLARLGPRQRRTRFCFGSSEPLRLDERFAIHPSVRDGRTGRMLPPRSNRHRPVNETPPLPLRRSSRALGSDSSPSRNAVTRSVPTA